MLRSTPAPSAAAGRSNRAPAPRAGVALGQQLRQRSGLRAPSNGGVTVAFFKTLFQKQSSDDAYANGLPTNRDNYDRDDVEQYFNYMGCLAVEGTYDRMYALLDAGIPAIDIILLFAAAEADLPKMEELLKAGANVAVTDLSGSTPLALAGKANPAKKAEAEALLRASGAK